MTWVVIHTLYFTVPSDREQILSLFWEEQRGLFFSGSMILLTNLLLWIMAPHSSHSKTLGSMALVFAWALLSWGGSSHYWTAEDWHVKEIQCRVRFCSLIPPLFDSHECEIIKYSNIITIKFTRNEVYVIKVWNLNNMPTLCSMWK